MDKKRDGDERSARPVGETARSKSNEQRNTASIALTDDYCELRGAGIKAKPKVSPSVIIALFRAALEQCFALAEYYVLSSGLQPTALMPAPRQMEAFRIAAFGSFIRRNFNSCI